MTLRTALDQGAELLTDGGIAVPRLTAEVLLSHAIRKDRVYLFTHPEAELSELGWIHYGRYLHQRLKGVPTQYITKRQEFYGRDFRVTPAVLIPRPETEHLVAAVLARADRNSRIIDVGTGSGAIAVSVQLESQAEVVASDISGDALAVAKQNAATHNSPVAFCRADLLQPFRASSFDIVASNPPYVALNDLHSLQREVREHEPHTALFAGTDGNALYQKLIEQAESALTSGGWLILELGYRSLDAVRDMLPADRWTQTEAIPDLAGIPRVLATRRQ